MTDLRAALTLTADASGLVGEVKRGRGEIDGLGQSAKQAGAGAQAAAGSVAAMGTAAQGAAQKTGAYRDAMGRLRDENGKFVKTGSEAAAAARAAGAAMEAMRDSARRAVGGLEAAAAAQKRVSGGEWAKGLALEGVADSARSLRSAMVGLATLDTAKNLALSAFEAARAYEDVETRIRFITKSQEATNAETAIAAKLADDLATSERAVLDIRSRLVPLEKSGTVSRKDSLAITAGLVNTQKAAGASTEGLERAMYGLNQVLTRGVANAEDYGQVIEALPPLASAMDRAVQTMTANSSANFRQMVNDGQVTSNFFARVLVQAMQEFEGAGAASLDALSGKAQAFHRELERLLRLLGDNRITDFLLEAGTATVMRLNPTSSYYQNPVPEDMRLQAQMVEATERLTAAEERLAAARASAGRYGRTSSVSIAAGEEAVRLAQAEWDALSGQLQAQQAKTYAAGVADAAEQKAHVEKTAREEALARFQRSEEGKRVAALEALTKAEKQLAEDREKGRLTEAQAAALAAEYAEKRKKLNEQSQPKASTTRDRAAETEAELKHARAMAQAATIRDDAARRSAEIAALSEEAARRSGYDPAKQSGEYARVREAEAEQLRAQDRIKAAEEARRTAAQDAATADREQKRKDAEALREQEAALKKIAEIDREAAVATAALGAARQAATEAATATTLEGLAEIEARAEEAKRRLAVKEAGDKAAEALEKGATPKQREDARAQAEATELAKQQAQFEERRLQTASALLGLRQEEARGAEAAARAQVAATAAASASSLADLAAVEARAEAAARLAETEERALDARLSLGAEATTLERDAAEASARGLAAEEERLRLSGLLLDQARALAEMRERGAEAEGRAAVSLRQAAAAAGARSTLELEAARKAAEADVRQLERAGKIKAAGERMGPEADPVRVREAEALAAAEWDRSEAARQAGEFIERRAAAIRFEERTAETLADLETQRAAYLSASGSAEDRARAAQLGLTVQQRIREAKAQQLPHDEAAIRAGAEREASAARELDLIQRRAAALEDLERRRKAAEEDAAAARSGPAAVSALSVRRAGEEAARPLGGDAEVAAAAMGEARARLHAEAVKDLGERLRGLQTPYKQALEEADRWREGALANLDPMAAGYREFAAEVEQVHARLYEDALQHSTDYFDGARRGLKELEEANRDWAKTSEGFVTGFASSFEDSFVSLAKTGKFEVGSLADFVIEQMARMAYQQAVAPAVNGFAGGLAKILGSFLGGSFGGGAGAVNAAAGSFKGFAGGGFTGEGGKYEVAGLAHRGEVIWSQADVARHGGAGLVDAMRRADPLAAASLMMRAAGRAGAAGYAEGGIGGRAAVFAPPAATADALMRAAGQGGMGGGGATTLNITIINETSQPVEAESRQKSDGSIEIRLREIAQSAVAQDIAGGRGPVSAAMQGRYQLAPNFGGRR